MPAPIVAAQRDEPGGQGMQPPSPGTFELAFASPRKLPSPRELKGGVAVLDIAFASDAGGSGKGFEKTTLPFIESLGSRLRVWVDHHDSEHHARFGGDPRFVLATKAEHGACPEMVTPELVARVGRVDTIVCHVDFDGLASAAKWMRAGIEPYPGCDDDARAVDTRLGLPGPVGSRIDRAIRARPKDVGLLGVIVRHLASGLADASLWGPIDAAGAELAPREAEARRLAAGYERLRPAKASAGTAANGGIVFVDASAHTGPYDKTLLLLLGQERAPASIVVDGDTVTFAARFDSGINFLTALGISGGMPTVVSVPRARLGPALVSLGVAPEDAARLSSSPA